MPVKFRWPWIDLAEMAAIFMPKTAILGTEVQFSQKLSDNFFSYLGKWSNIMMSFYGANAVLIESLLLGVQ